MTKSANAQTRKGLAKSLGKATVALGLAAMMLATTGCNKLLARDKLNKGVQAYKANRFEQAEDFFRKAISMDPELAVAKLYLATACFSQYVPGGDSPENKQKADCAIEQYKSVLESTPNQQTKVLSIKGLASIYFSMKDFENAKGWDKKAIEADPNDPENYYSAAVVDWTESYVPRMEARNKAGITKPEDPIKDKKLCEEIKDKNEQRVQEGIDLLNKALTIRKDYEDAMSYLNLLYRERADIECGDPDARKADLDKADDYVQQVMNIKKIKAEKANEQHGIVLDQPKQ
jgi:tetratricopeptide (TPR) repeat protein